MDRDDKFWDRIARKYAAQPVADVPSWEQTLDHIRRYLTPESAVLEIGGGTGSSALKLAPDAKEILCSDVSEEMMVIAEEKRLAAGINNIRFTRGVAGDAHLEREGGYDAVVALNLLHLVPEPPETFCAVFHLLRPGGVFISKTACLREMNPFIRFAIPVMQLFGKAPRHVHYLRGEEWVDLLRASGFEVVESCRYPVGGTTQFVVARRPD